MDNVHITGQGPDLFTVVHNFSDLCAHGGSAFESVDNGPQKNPSLESTLKFFQIFWESNPPDSLTYMHYYTVGLVLIARIWELRVILHL